MKKTWDTLNIIKQGKDNFPDYFVDAKGKKMI